MPTVPRVLVRDFFLGVPMVPFENLPGKLSNARGQVLVFSVTAGGFEMGTVVSGLPANISCTVFLVENPVPPFGSALQVGTITTDAAGKGSMFVSMPVLPIKLPADTIRTLPTEPPAETGEGVPLNHVVLWFERDEDDDNLFPLTMDGKVVDKGPSTPFAPGGNAGIAMMTDLPAGVGVASLQMIQEGVPQV